MSWWQQESFANRIPNLIMRDKTIRKIRAFFYEREYLEVETSALQLSAGMEVHVKAFETELYSANRQEKSRKFLHTSPEIAMKKLLVAGLPKIFQICQVFRNAEGSPTHSPSFTMIEWYQTNLDYHELMNESIDFIRSVSNKKISWNDLESNPFQDWEIITVCKAFQKYADIDLESIINNRDGFAEICGVKIDDKANWEDIFFAVFLEKIEPNLGSPVPTIIYDYPVSMAALSRVKEGNDKFAERFEIYICGLELANAFGELTDAKIQKQRFEKAMIEKKAIYGEDYPIDADFITALEHGMPMASGIALGIDRLVMLLTGEENIKQVQAWE